MRPLRSWARSQRTRLKNNRSAQFFLLLLFSTHQLGPAACQTFPLTEFCSKVAESRLQNVRVWSDGVVELISNWSAFVSKLGDIASDVFEMDLGAGVASMQNRFEPLLNGISSLTKSKQEFPDLVLRLGKALTSSVSVAKRFLLISHDCQITC